MVKIHYAYRITGGQWYFLRVLWSSDGLSQREECP
jgi:hypothetical protein